MLLKADIQRVLNLIGLSLHRRSTISRLIAERNELQGAAARLMDERLLTAAEECERLRAELREHANRQIFSLTTEDPDYFDKTRRIVDGIEDFGKADFAQLTCWLFASSLINHKIIGGRLDEGSLLWRAVKMSGGPILEVGRDHGGSTLVLLGASGSRFVVSIDRAPDHARISDIVFSRPDVSRRLKLYNQSSREPIAESEFGMIFIDADHSYEGICQDIGTYWNMLKPFDGKPAIAVFHDAADNPITYVEPVKHACEELLSEPGVARVVESWGSMLVLEKLNDIDPNRWYPKENRAFWEQYATPEHPALRPLILSERLHLEKATAATTFVNLLGTDNIERDSWEKRGVKIEFAQLNADNPLRLLLETPDLGEHGIEKFARLNSSRFRFMVFLRPCSLKMLRLSVLTSGRTLLAHVDFELTEKGRIATTSCKDGVEIIDAGFHYRNGYFGCDLSVSLSSAIPSAVFAVNALEDTGGTAFYKGREGRGFWVNLFSVRDLLTEPRSAAELKAN
jgi:predicted O-methyltransferase YrrM